MSPTPQPTEEQAKALQEFADEVGKAWAHALHTAWGMDPPSCNAEIEEEKRPPGRGWLLSALDKIRPRKMP